MGHIQPETDGRTSGAHVTADKMIWGTDIGGELRWIPSSTVPLGFEASLAVGGYQPAGSTVIVDGDTPFEQSFDVKRLRVGAVLELP